MFAANHAAFTPNFNHRAAAQKSAGGGHRSGGSHCLGVVRANHVLNTYKPVVCVEYEYSVAGHARHTPRKREG
jgi:hypothetical protein